MTAHLPTIDRDWHACYPAVLRAAASLHFSEVAVVHATSDWLVGQAMHGPRTPPARFIDLGAGAGKFCLIAAARHPTVEWHGVEIRRRLVDLAEAWCAIHGLPNCSFVRGDVAATPLDRYTGAFLFNPFGELLDPQPDLGSDLARGTAAYRAACAGLRQNLSRTPPGFTLVSYFTAGDEIPGSFQQRWEAEDGKLVGWVQGG